MFLNLITVLLVTLTGYTDTCIPRGGGLREYSYTVPDSGGIRLDDPWALTDSLEIMINGRLLTRGTEYLWHDSLRIIEFTQDSMFGAGNLVTIRYKSVSVIDTLQFQRFYLSSLDTSSSYPHPSQTLPRERPLDPFASWKGLRRSGSITRGVHFGSESGGGVTSGLHLELFGKPKPGVNVAAIMDDRDMPATSSGASASLRELDRILFQVTTPHINARFGDLDLVLETGRYAAFTRRLKGGSLAFDYPVSHLEAAAAGGDNAFITNNFPGRDGDQGPYELTGSRDVRRVTVVSGSEKVHLDGKLLKRGRRADYTIDYSRGLLTFNTQHPICSDSRIEVEFEYNDDAYPRYFYAASAGIPGIRQSGLYVEAAAVIEGQDGENPLAFDWTGPRRRAVEAIGDSYLGAQVSGIDSVGIGRGDYKWRSVADSVVLEFSEPDERGHPTGYLNVVFSPYPSGGYVKLYDDTLRAFRFVAVGPDSGDWAPVRNLPTPEKASLTNVRTVYSYDGLTLSGEAAFSNYDRNTLSARDDDNNIGSAWFCRSNWETGSDQQIRFDASIRHEDENFHPLARPAVVDHQYIWNLPDDNIRSETEIDAGVGFRFSDRAELLVSSGYLERGHQFTGRRHSFSGRWDLTVISLSSDLQRIDGEYKDDGKRSQRTTMKGSAERKHGILRPLYGVRYEKSHTSGSVPLAGYEYLEHETGLGITLTARQDLNLRFSYRADDELADEEINHLSDTRTLNAGWKGAGFEWGGWSAEMLRYYQTYANPFEPSVISTSAGFETAVAPPDAPWSLRLNYNLVTGSDRATVEIYSYVGEGEGGYSKQGSRYVPDFDGDFDRYDTATDLLKLVSRIDFTGQLNWDFRKRKRSQGEIETYPFGIRGTYFRFEMELTTTDNDPYLSFLLYPPEFSKPDVILVRRDYLAEINFLEGHSGGDGRLILRKRLSRDRYSAGGEENVFDEVSFRLRKRIENNLQFQVIPAFEHTLRRSATSQQKRADVLSAGADAGLTFHSPNSSMEYGLSYGYEHKRDRVPGQSVDERRIIPLLKWNLGSHGVARAEGTWRRLTSGSDSPGYDLTREWIIGDNWTFDIGFDYNLGSNIIATAFYRGRWRGDSRPHNSGLIEFTAKL